MEKWDKFLLCSIFAEYYGSEEKSVVSIYDLPVQ